VGALVAAVLAAIAAGASVLGIALWKIALAAGGFALYRMSAKN
jgi:hypothetical protein